MIDEPDQRRIAMLLAKLVRERHPAAALDDCQALFETSVARWRASRVWRLGAGDGLAAAIVLTEEADARWGPPEPLIHVVVDGSDGALAWASAQIGEIADELPAQLSCRIPVEWRGLVDPLRAVGFGVAKVGIEAQVTDAARLLTSAAHVPPADLEVTMRLAANADDAKASVLLSRDYFVAHPEHGWAARTLTAAEQQEIDDRMQAEMLGRVERAEGLDWVIVTASGEVVGGFGLTTPMASPVVGLSASVGICLGPSIQRRGVGNACYLTMLERARELGIGYLHGTTSNPGVIRVARRFGVGPRNWLLRRDGPWISDDLTNGWL